MTTTKSVVTEYLAAVNSFRNAPPRSRTLADATLKMRSMQASLRDRLVHIGLDVSAFDAWTQHPCEINREAMLELMDGLAVDTVRVQMQNVKRRKSRTI